MSFYSWALLVHIFGVMVLYMAIAVELLCLHRLRAATTTDQVRVWASLTKTIDKPLPLGTVAILASGLYMAATAWGWGSGWVIMSLATVLTMGVVGPAVNSRRMAAIAASAETALPGAIPPALASRVHDRVLITSVYVLAALGLGVVYLKVDKPDLLGAIVALVVAAALGALAAHWNAGRAKMSTRAASPYASIADQRR